jgi:hypothetical protein
MEQHREWVARAYMLNGRFMYADLGLLLYRICTPLHTGLPYVTERPLEMVVVVRTVNSL